MPDHGTCTAIITRIATAENPARGRPLGSYIAGSCESRHHYAPVSNLLARRDSTDNLSDGTMRSPVYILPAFAVFAAALPYRRNHIPRSGRSRRRSRLRLPRSSLW